MEERKVQRGHDGLFTLCFRDREKTDEKIMEEVEQYGKCISIKRIAHGIVFIRFKEEDEAQRCLDGNPHMNIGVNKKEKDAPKQPVKKSKWKSWKGESKTAKEKHAESLDSQDENCVENAETAPQKCRSIDIQEERKAAVNGPKQNAKTPKCTGKTDEVNGELQTSYGKLDSLEQRTLNMPNEMPPLINRAKGRPPKKLAVDMIFANFPDNITRDDIENLVETLYPLKVGSILKTKYNEPYCHVYVTEEAAIIAERDYNLAQYGDYHLIVARARTLLAEALKRS